ncbi:MAG TPA: hypothetical protein VFL99_05305 [Segeticoccus sp.]|uniref:hypothetical protein n=1 Tax=Segeticoccus sp. TaxID=2706531 RepID=UPI002D800D00|nr:hypothetical protein [Segeticoccus sp.]HET8599724.1 hypothetical protein [Segeticoccus sp.]
MGPGVRIVAAVASGYLLGRRHKLRLAIAVGGLIAGKKLSTNPRQLARQAQELVENNPQLAELSEQVRTQLFEAARLAAVKVATDRVTGLTENLQGRTKQLLQAAESGAGTEQLKRVEAGDEEPPAEDEDSTSDQGEESSDEGEEATEAAADEETDTADKKSAEEEESSPDESSGQASSNQEPSDASSEDDSADDESSGSRQKRSGTAKKSTRSGSAAEKTSKSSGRRS